MDRFPCGSRTKWSCNKLWLEPMRFYDNYRALVALAAPIVARYDEILQPMLSGVDDYVRTAMKTGPENFWSQLGMTRAEAKALTVYPAAIRFGGAGVIWDQTLPCGTTYLLIGVLFHSVQELVRNSPSNSEYLVSRLRSISDPRRLEILKALKKSPMYSQEIAELLSLSPATISHHMTSLVTSGLISVEKQGTRVRYSLEPQNIDRFLRSLRGMLMQD